MANPGEGKPRAGFRFFRVYPSFFRYWLSCVINRCGDSLDMIAHTWLILELTGSPLMMGGILVANMLPNIFLGPFTGVLADRWDRKRLVVVCDTMRGLAMAAVAALFYLGRLQVWYLYAAAALVSVFEAFQAPARGALTPAMVTKEDLMPANSLNSLAESIAQLIGLAAAGVVIGIVGIAGAIAIDALTFWVSALLIATLRLPEMPRSAARLNIRNFFRDFVTGLRFIFGARIVLRCVILAGLTNFFLGPLNVLLPAFVKLELRVPVTGLSQAYLLETAAMLLASLAVGGVGKRLGDAGVMRLGLFLMAAGYALLYLARDLGTTMAFLCVLAFGVPFAVAGFQTLMQKNTPLEMMGRIGAVRGTLVLGAMPLSTAVAGALGERIHAPILFGALGVLIIICTVVITFDRIFKSSGGTAAGTGREQERTSVS